MLFKLFKRTKPSIDKVTVRDQNFEVLKVISDPEILGKVQEQWDSLIRIKEFPNYNWTHKIDIRSDRSDPRSLNGRWLYNSEGYVVYLDKRLKPAYKVLDVKLFNEIFLS